MLCIHGLDDSNCPVCRTSRLSVPKGPLDQIDTTNDSLKPENPSLKKYQINKKEFEQEIAKIKGPVQPKLITSIPRPNLINDLPVIATNPLMDRLNMLNINKLDSHGISKRVPVKKAEIDLSKD